MSYADWQESATVTLATPQLALEPANRGHRVIGLAMRGWCAPSPMIQCVSGHSCTSDPPNSSDGRHTYARTSCVGGHRCGQCCLCDCVQGAFVQWWSATACQPALPANFVDQCMAPLKAAFLFFYLATLECNRTQWMAMPLSTLCGASACNRERMCVSGGASAWAVAITLILGWPSGGVTSSLSPRKSDMVFNKKAPSLGV
jgi:hypothetical protein